MLEERINDSRKTICKFELDDILLCNLMSVSFTKNDRNVNKLCSTLQKKLDPVSKVTGIPEWHWILGIKCSDTTGVGLVY